MFEVNTTKHGAVFSPGQVHQAVDAWLDTATHDVANEGATRVRAQLDHVLKHQTGFYVSHVVAQSNVVSDSEVVYGPWLEGTGSANKTTRFKGYATFRKVAQKLRTDANEIASRTLPDLVRRLS